MKKDITIILVVLLIVIMGISSYYVLKEANSISTFSNKKILVVYYSAQSHTESVVKKIASNLNADIFEIVPKDVIHQMI